MLRVGNHIVFVLTRCMDICELKVDYAKENCLLILSYASLSSPYHPDSSVTLMEPLRFNFWRRFFLLLCCYFTSMVNS